ncbi:putative N-terminal acetyltransferase 2 [Erysiphe neolycopersici]|uniref:Putative N-terminal acetyltransferase 2 n=1 Tax=Erysiphe neolycopersici TaxID=212602 RepID=A0A420HR25_9PEZI|nr:putative N-terminal acetyltransferase 2 [Erysiphe neolycopersici]
MFIETFCTLISGIPSLSPAIRKVPRKTILNVVPRRQYSQRFGLVNPFTRKICSKKQDQLRSSALTYRKYLFHHSCKCANQISTSLKTDLSLGAKIKKLSREYGWSAFGVYLALSALDFPICFLLVKYLGSERIGKWEQAVTSSLKSLIPEDFKRTCNEWSASIQSIRASSHSSQEGDNNKDVDFCEKTSSSNVEDAEKNNKKDASIATQLALAYAIHKSFIFVRVPLTAAITPKIVKMLRGWGWDIGKRTTREAKFLNRAKLRIKLQKPITRKKKFLRFAKFTRFGKDR